MILKTERLLLRPMVQSDAAALFAILGDGEAMRFWDRPALPRLATVEAVLADELLAMAAGGFHYWMVMLGGDAIGGVDISHDDGTSAWTGFLLRRDRWGQGYGSEALAAVIAHGFGPLGLERLMARVQTGNERAVRLLRRHGFQDGGALADVARADGRRACRRYDLSKSAAANGA